MQPDKEDLPSCSIPECSGNHLARGFCRRHYGQQYYKANLSTFKSYKAGRPLYSVWVNIIHRCCNENSKDFHRYGGRGITVCERWRDYKSFVEDVLPTWKRGLQADRKNNDGNYEPANFRWVTPKENTNNRRNTVWLSAFGISKPLGQWASDVGIPVKVLYGRIYKGWPVIEALTQPVGLRRNRTN